MTWGILWGQGGGATLSYSVQDALSLEAVLVSAWHSDPRCLAGPVGWGWQEPTQTCRELPLHLPVHL